MTIDAALTASEAGHLVERNEARAYAALMLGAGANLTDRYGLEMRTIGGAQVLVSAGIGASLMLNRVIGLGVWEPATDATLDAVDETFAQNGVAAFAAEVVPNAEPSDLAARLRLRKYVPFKAMSMLYRGVEPVASVDCDLQVRRVGNERAPTFAELVCRVFQLGEPFPALLAASFDSPSWQHFMAFARDEPVAAAMTHIDGDAAWIGWVCTLPEYRGRGAQSAMTAAQLHAAHEAKCRWVTLEAATGTRNQPSTSLRNYVRLGWTPVYDRIAYIRKLGARG